MRARSVNALRRPIAIAMLGAILSGGVLVLLLLVPGRATRASTAAAAQIPERPDTTRAVDIRNRALLQIATADSLLNVARRELALPEQQPLDTLPPHLIQRRQELAAAISALNALITRANNAPLPSSYRALGESRVMLGVGNVRELLDSLTAIERERESFGSVTGVDPMYIALTARASAVGRAILSAAEGRRAELRAALAPLLPPRPPPRPVVVIDTLRVLAQRDEAARYLLGARTELARMRERSEEIDELERRARELREVGAPLSATVGASIVVGLALGFALVLFAEMSAPRVADSHEAEQNAGVRVMAVARPRVVIPERDRRRSDIFVPETLDPYAEHYRQMYLHITTREEPLTSLTITGDHAEIAAVVAVNVAAFNVREARSAMVVDTDPGTAGVSRALEVPGEPGLSEVLGGTVSWTDAVQYVPIGRDQVLAVLPSGRRGGQPSPERAARARADLGRLSPRHDLIVFATPVNQARRHPTTVLLSDDVVVCARIGHTRIKTLRSMIERLRSAGMTIHGLLLWDAEPPKLAKPMRVGGRSARERPPLPEEPRPVPA